MAGGVDCPCQPKRSPSMMISGTAMLQRSPETVLTLVLPRLTLMAISRYGEISGDFLVQSADTIKSGEVYPYR